MRTRLLHYIPAFFLFVLTLLCPSFHTGGVAHAQAGQAEIIGEVRDHAGAAIARAHVMVTEVSTGRSFTSTTGGVVYTITNLRSGDPRGIQFGLKFNF